MKIISPRIHRYFDYITYYCFILAPIFLGITGILGGLPYVLAVIYLVIILKDFPLGVAKRIPLAVHGWVEHVVGLLLVLISFVPGFAADTPTRVFYISIGIVIILVGLLTDYQGTPKVERDMFHPHYKKALEILGESPEIVEHPIPFVALLVVSLFVALLLGIFDGQVWLRSITWWEIIALIDTVSFAILYFMDLDKQPEETMKSGRKTLHIGVWWAFNLGMFLVAGIILVLHDLFHQWTVATLAGITFDWMYTLYLVFLIISFGIFVFLDYSFADISTEATKIREYWALLFFVDAPAFIAFFFLLLLYGTIVCFSGNTLNLDFFAGAVVMQILIADTLFLVVGSNFHNHVLMRLCHGVTDRRTPMSGHILQEGG